MQNPCIAAGGHKNHSDIEAVAILIGGSIN
jgi:hypothetical protein